MSVFRSSCDQARLLYRLPGLRTRRRVASEWFWRLHCKSRGADTNIEGWLLHAIELLTILTKSLAPAATRSFSDFNPNSHQLKVCGQLDDHSVSHTHVNGANVHTGRSERPTSVGRRGSERREAYSCRNAVSGSTRSARRAGATVAAIATIESASDTMTNVDGSPG
jgi:hypothetical protein